MISLVIGRLSDRIARSAASSNCCSNHGDVPRSPATTLFAQSMYSRRRSSDQSDAGLCATARKLLVSRASLGHTGQVLSASAATQAVYASIVVAALARVCAALDPTYSIPLMDIAGVAWSGAFLGFALAYAPLLCRTRKS